MLTPRINPPNAWSARPLAAFALGALAIVGGTIAVAFYISHQLNTPQAISALRQSCAGQAERVFRAQGWRLGGRQPDGRFAGYRARYNPRLGKCFVVIGVLTRDPRDHETRFSSTVADAFEQRTYAEYFSSRTRGLAPYVTCKLTVPHEKPVFCHSAREWHRLIAPYVGPTGSE
ncbi:MAG TPA: hypothetical protein VLC74_09915 [Rhizomicrobium sp.]|nr:hypothetical protein [Rhizomicrobium sp.]